MDNTAMSLDAQLGNDEDASVHSPATSVTVQPEPPSPALIPTTVSFATSTRNQPPPTPPPTSNPLPREEPRASMR
eukprot:1814853-Prymnesium_polylepis.1